MLIRFLVGQGISTITGKDGKVFEAKTGTPDRVEVARIVLRNRILVDVVTNFCVVAGTAWEQNSVDLLEFLVSDALLVRHDEGHNTGACRLHESHVGLHDVGGLAFEARV